jgi:hypothetical protein
MQRHVRLTFVTNKHQPSSLPSELDDRLLLSLLWVRPFHLIRPLIFLATPLFRLHPLPLRPQRRLRFHSLRRLRVLLVRVLLVRVYLYLVSLPLFTTTSLPPSLLSPTTVRRSSRTTKGTFTNTKPSGQQHISSVSLMVMMLCLHIWQSSLPVLIPATWTSSILVCTQPR